MIYIGSSHFVPRTKRTATRKFYGRQIVLFNGKTSDTLGKFCVFTAVWIRTPFFWDMTLSQWVIGSSQHARRTYFLYLQGKHWTVEENGNTFLGNWGNYRLPTEVAAYPRRMESPKRYIYVQLLCIVFNATFIFRPSNPTATPARQSCFHFKWPSLHLNGAAFFLSLLSSVVIRLKKTA